MKKLNTFILIMQAIIFASHAQTAGTPDSTFSNDGMAIFNWQGNYYANRLLEQPDGKLLMSGGKDGKYFIMRINSDSTLDAGFGINGVAEDSLPGYYNNISAMHLDPNGKIIISLHCSNAPLAMFGYARYLTTGIIDSTFGTNGYVLKTPSPDLHYKNLISPAFNNQYIIAESIDDFMGNPVTYERLNYDGTFDATFGNAGSILLPDYRMEGTAWLPSGKFIFFGVESFASDYSLIRFNGNGVIDSSYGNNGTVLEPFPSITSFDNIFADNDGNVFTTLQYGFPSTTFRISKFDSAGVKDSGFGIAGDKDFNNDRFFYSLAFEPGGKILASGYHITATGTENLLQRWLADGTDDITFANAGELLFISATQSSETASVILLSLTGKIYTVNNANDQSTQDSYFFVARYHNDSGTGINDVVAEHNGFIIYPNPANDEFTISQVQFSENEKVELKIFDVIGKEIYFSRVTTSGFKLQTSTFIDGIYIVQLIQRGAESKTKAQKLNINH